MSANFTPAQGSYDSPAPFSAWSHKVLPSVFDDSLSYYETLCKLTQYINSLLTIHSSMGTDITNLFKAYEALQNYCNDYFDDADVQDEINQKLDSMAKDGSLSALIGEYVAPLYKSQDYRITALENRVNNLSKLGEGSTTGDAELQDIRLGYAGAQYDNAGEAVRKQIGDLNNGQMSVELNGGNTAFTIGKLINGETGALNTSEYYSVSEYVKVYGGEQISSKCSVDNAGVSLIMYVCEYTAENVSSYIKRTPIKQGGCVTLDPNTRYIRFSFGRSTASGIKFTESDLDYFNASVTNLYERITDMLDNTMYHRELADHTMHVDNLTHFGVYGWGANDRPDGSPFSDACVMLVAQQVMTNNPAHGRMFQLAVSSTGLACRYKQSAKYTPWIYSGKLTTVDSVKLDALIHKNLVSFTPLKTIDSSNEDGYFKSGVEYSGVPYSSVHYVSNDVFFNRSIETLMSAFNNKDSALYNYVNNLAPTSGVWCGGVCSSYVSWACNLPIYYTTWDFLKMLEFKDVKCPEDVEIGDVLICHTTLPKASDGDHAMIVSGIVTGETGVVAIEISEMWHPVFRKLTYDRDKFMGLLNGKTRSEEYYYVGRFPNLSIRTIPDFKVNTDIITEYGDNTYFEVGESVYIQSKNSVITYLPPESEDVYEVDLSTLGKKAGTDMYNITSILNKIGRYTLYGVDGEESHITMIKKGTVSLTHTEEKLSKMKVTLDGYLGCKPVGYAIIGIFVGEGRYYDTHMDDPSYTASRLSVSDNLNPNFAGKFPEGAFTIYTHGSGEISYMSNFTIDLETMPEKYEYFYIRVFYDTGCGQAWQDSIVAEKVFNTVTP